MTMPQSKDRDGNPIIFEAYRGDTFRVTLTFESGDAPHVLPDGDWSAQIRSSADASVALGAIDVDATNAATGILVLSIPPANTRTYSDGVFDLQVIDGADVQTFIQGRIVFRSDVTRA